jgi:hypothetical protein
MRALPPTGRAPGCGRGVRRAIIALLLAVHPSAAGAQQPWFSSTLRVDRDDQPRTGLMASAQLGRFLTPDVTLAVDLAGHRYTAGRIQGTTASAGGTATLGLPALRTGLEVSSAILLGAPGAGPALTYRLAARRDVGSGIAVRGHVARDRYTATIASLDTLVLADVLELAIDRSADPGWAGALVARRESYGDGNPVTTAFVWALAPVSRSARHALRAGYAASRQDAEGSRWVPHGGPATGPPGQQVAGRYDPYYTPHDVVVHSLLVNAAAAAGAGWLLADGSIGVHARETAPVISRGQPQQELRFYERRFTPFRAALTAVAPVGDRTSMTAGAEYASTAYYRTGSIRIAFARSL